MNTLERYAFGIAIATLVAGGSWYALSTSAPEPSVIANIPETVTGELVFVDRIDLATRTLAGVTAEWLAGEAAYAAAAEDTGCAREVVEECAPSLANDFYIRTMEYDAVEYTVAEGAPVLLQENAQEVR